MRAATQGSGFLSTIVGSVSEAWAELRIHRTRVLLSLIGVAVAVAALTSVVGISAIASQAQAEQMERWGGRPATLIVGGAYDMVSGESADPATLQRAFDAAVDRYGIGHATRVSFAALPLQLITGVHHVDLQVIDPAYGPIHRIGVVEGRWFTDSDTELLAPPIIINQQLHAAMGSPALSRNPTVLMLGDDQLTAVVVGITRAGEHEPPAALLLTDSFQRLYSPANLKNFYSPSFEFWVPAETSSDLQSAIRQDFLLALGEGEWDLYLDRTDYQGMNEGYDPMEPFRLIFGGIAVLVLALGALGLLNIAMVTVRQRVREIGIRRSFGATAGRVFFTVMMESVVATVVAGLAGVVLAMFVVQNPFLYGGLTGGYQIQDAPGFPVEAAIIGLVAATAVGTLAGLLPALYAVRVKVIDAIRF